MNSISSRLEETSRWDKPGSAGFSAAVSWPAVFAGATAAAALSLILLVLGTGLGLAVVSPWAAHGASVEKMSWATIIWIAFAALASSGLGGYLAGRLRVKWPTLRMDEVYFRDTAHGFLAWAVATLLTAAALTSVIGTVLGAGTTTGAGAAAGSVQAVGQGIRAAAEQPAAREDSQSLYFVDSLFRASPTDPTLPPPPVAANAGDAAFAAMHTEIARIFDTSLREGPLSADDRRHAAQVVAQRTGLSQQDADARVLAAYNAAQEKMRQAEARAKAFADQARKAGAYAALWIFVSLLLGAFFASLMATVGGRQRDMF
jgi:hypothetical protein